MIASAPASAIACAKDTTLVWLSSQPLRIFTVKGKDTARLTAFTMATARSGWRIKAHPSPFFTILGAGQPMLISNKLAPFSTIICAASAIISGWLPQSCTAIGLVSPSKFNMAWVSLFL